MSQSRNLSCHPPSWSRRAGQWVVLFASIALGGCGVVNNMIYKTTGDVMQGFSRNHTVPYLMESNDLAMGCAMSEATAPLLMSFGRVTNEPDQLAVMLYLSAGGCADEQAREHELAALAALQADPDVDQQALSDPAIRLWASHPAIRRALETAQDGFPDRPSGAGFKPLTTFLADELIISALSWSIVAHPGMEAWLTRTRAWLLDHAVSGNLGRVDAEWLAAIALQVRAAEWVWFETEEERDLIVSWFEEARARN